MKKLKTEISTIIERYSLFVFYLRIFEETNRKFLIWRISYYALVLFIFDTHFSKAHFLYCYFFSLFSGASFKESALRIPAYYFIFILYFNHKELFSIILHFSILSIKIYEPSMHS